ncbi:MAG: polymerase subunit delta, polymerase subunit delta protein [Parcubacteria group bacterium]|nr:polymerase subunit delta, polymerase subunit delta protein [Parcubacteria group bacterium]
MAHHAYVYAGELEEGIEAALVFAENELSMPVLANPDIAVWRHGLFSVDDARAAGMFAAQAPIGDKKLMVIAASRLFHEAQNALLKLFEEPPEGTTLILIIPAEGILLPTLRSRILMLPNQTKEKGKAEEYLKATVEARAKIVAKLIDRTKGDKDEEKQAARLEMLHILEGITRAAYAARSKAKDTHELDLFLSDLDRFIPMLHDRSAPYKLIFEHLSLVLPKELR